MHDSKIQRKDSKLSFLRNREKICILGSQATQKNFVKPSLEDEIIDSMMKVTIFNQILKTYSSFVVSVSLKNVKQHCNSIFWNYKKLEPGKLTGKNI